MIDRLRLTSLVLTGCLLAASQLAGCGGDGETTQTVPYVPVTGEEAVRDDLDARIEALQELEFTVEIVTNGASSGIWSQKAGNWRWEDPRNPGSYIIYNAGRNQTWSVSGEAATVVSGSAIQQYLGMSPASMLASYAALPATAGSEESWELDLPGKGRLAIEFRGPEGLPSMITSTDAATGETEIIEFRYSSVGAVPDSLFELPQGVQVEQGSGGGGFEITVPQG